MKQKSFIQFRQFIFNAGKKTLLLLLLVKATTGYSQDKALVDSARVPVPFFKYQQEYAFDSPADPAAWNKEPHGLQVSFATTDKAFFRAEVPSLNKSQTWELTGWKGERLNAQIIVWSPDTLNQVKYELPDLRDDKGNRILKENLKLDMIRYIISNYPYDAKEVTCGVGPSDKAYLMPDRFESFDRFDLPGKTIRPLWLSIQVPATAAAGIYKGILKIKSETHTRYLQLSVKVQNQLLPAPKDWSFRLDLWQNPWVLAEYYKVKPWGEEHKNLLRKHMKLYAGAGGKYITTYAVHSPWSDNSYMIEGGMIEWIRQVNGQWKFDYNIFDQYVQLAIESGVDKAITIYTPIPWGERFRFMDEKTGNYITEQWLPTSDKFKANWNVFLTDLQKHLKAKGWLTKTFLGINENAMEQTLAAIRVIKNHSRSWKITYAGDWHVELDSLLDDYSCVYGKEPTMKDVVNRNARGAMTTFYVCCTPAKPNTFVFSPPVEGRWLGWYTSAFGYNGFLRWAYDAWPADPVRDARHVLWPAGDCFMVYPGAATSIRYEKMREGIADFEKLRLIRSKASRSTNAEVKKRLDELNQQLKTLTLEKEFNSEKLEKDLETGKKLLEELSELLGK